MALPDLTGQNIQDTYQRVLQIGDGGTVFDGTGSLPPVLQITASHAISASIEVFKEISSSYAETSSFSSEFTVRGDVIGFEKDYSDNKTFELLSSNTQGSFAIYNGNNFTKRIQMSGDGNTIFNVGDFFIGGNADTDRWSDGGAEGPAISGNTDLRKLNVLDGIFITGSNSTGKITLDNGHITASGNISTSFDSDITSHKFVIGPVDLSDFNNLPGIYATNYLDGTVSEIITSFHPSTVSFGNLTNQFGFYSKNMALYSSQSLVVDINREIKLDSKIGHWDFALDGFNQLSIRSVATSASIMSNYNLDLVAGQSIPSIDGYNQIRMLAQTGSSPTVIFNAYTGHITASGNISASAYYGDGSNLTGIDGNPFTHVTASGNISASGHIQTPELKGDISLGTGFETSGYLSSSVLYVGDPTTFVSASLGNISASGTIVGSNLSGTNTGDQDLSSFITSIPDGTYSSSLQTLGNITSSGNIRAVGHISASGDLTGDDLILKSKRIYSDASFIAENPHIILTDNNEVILGDSEDAISATKITVTPDASRISYELPTTGKFNVVANKLEFDGQGNFIAESASFAKGITTTSITASGDISASGEIYGETISVRMDDGGIVTSLTNPERFYTSENQDLGSTLNTNESITSIAQSIPFIAPYSCSLESVSWYIQCADASAVDGFPIRVDMIKLELGDGDTAINCTNIIAPTTDEFTRVLATRYVESNGYYVRNTYEGAKFAPGQALIPIYSGSADAGVFVKLTVRGSCHATFRRIKE
jgi:hypothetical protein